MRLRVRTLSNEEAEIEISPAEDATVFTLKEKIQQHWPHMPAARQRLVHAGRVLGDAVLLADASLKENDRLVVMLSKGVPAVAAVSSAASINSAAPAAEANDNNSSNCSSSRVSNDGQPSSATADPFTNKSDDLSATVVATPSAQGAAANTALSVEEQQQSLPSASASSAPASTTTAAVGAQPPLQAQEAAESALFTGPQLEETLGQLVAMGFPREQAEHAMRAAFNNPDRAVEYLMNGLPEDVASLFGRSGAPSGASEEVNTAEPAVSAEEEDAGEEENDGAPDVGSNPLAALRRHPAFNQIRQMVQANPAMLPQVLQLIGSSNPQLLELITRNQDAFLDVLQQDDGGTDDAGSRQQQGESVAERGAEYIQVSQDELEALQRLEALGFTRHQAVEAYLACDRNEEMAANFLFENINDMEGEGGSGGE